VDLELKLPVTNGNGVFSGRYELEFKGPPSGLSVLKHLPEHRPAIRDSWTL